MDIRLLVAYNLHLIRTCNGDKMNNRKNTTIFILAFVAVMSLMTVLVLADSDPPFGVQTINEIQSSRPDLTTYPPDSVEITAGNVTEVNLYGISTTKAWAGYYGNITGTITLQTSDGYVFYNWTSIRPKGEIYAATVNSITWADIKCFDYAGGAGQPGDLTWAETLYGIDSVDEDGFNETFLAQTNNAFQVGTVPIGANTCQTANTYVYGLGGPNGNDFENVILTDAVNLVFTTIIENHNAGDNSDVTGFDNRPHQFQLLIAEDGHDGQEDTTTTYYFWAEIE